MKYFFLLLSTLTLIGCASKLPPITTYTYDVYQYKIESQDFAKLQKEIKSTNKNSDLIIMNSEKFWKLIGKLEQESFFSTYQYSSIGCKISESGNLSIKNQPCTYKYSNNDLAIYLTANSYKKDQIYYNLKLQPKNESMTQSQINYHSSKEYFFFTYKNSIDHLLFIIYKNELNIPWDYYKNSPQQHN